MAADAGLARDTATPPSFPPGYVGSSQCRECHEPFYELWSTSHHGLAMQPFTAEFARKNLTPQTDDIVIGPYRYRAVVEGEQGWVIEKGPDGEKRYPIHHAMGGKNVYYFLTPMERGRLQVLPVAYNVRTRKWYDTTGSMVRHFLDRPDAPLHWQERPLTFNSACHGCHVSQLSTNYDFATDTYRTVWTEPGINCETCHGPGDAHVRAARELPAGQPMKDLKIISTKNFSADQINSLCAPCHAKMHALTASFIPGDRYFDHYGLVTFEDPDFYPDGRDLGENYTYTLWRMNPCAKSGRLHCMHCHTSSGRYRFADKAVANHACLPCHKERVEKAVEHTHHKPDSPGNLCIACHMPMTEFALMRRSDHSMLPPAPAATLRFKSPNACNLPACHADKDAAWSDHYVRQWHTKDYQAPVLHRATLVEAARKRDWSRLPDILNYWKSPDREEIVTVSLIRLTHTCDDDTKWPALLALLDDPSPLVRASAVTALEPRPAPEVRRALLRATGDNYRIVRVFAAAALAALSREGLDPKDLDSLNRATAEYEAMLHSRRDDWASHYNLGNYFADRGESQRALDAYAAAMRLDPTRVPPLVNASMVHARQGDNAQAEALLRKAIALEPENAEANFNLGLLLAEQGKSDAAIACLRTAFKSDPTLAPAAYNLAVLLSKSAPAESLDWCRKAAMLRPAEPRYAYTLAFYLNEQGNRREAETVLRGLIRRHPAYPDAYFLLAALYEEQARIAEALDIYNRALAALSLSAAERAQLEYKIRALRTRDNRLKP
ncbi:MAG: tetratricopeptide repeat protein [Candidatus Sumerlaeia bacterium]|nr:tetratricopeptide repeat protein [Candidatus Sumerlaeia bacterium]